MIDGSGISDECHWTLLRISQHWFRKWLGAVRQQAITWASVDPDLCHHMGSLGPNELSLDWLCTVQFNFYITSITLWAGEYVCYPDVCRSVLQYFWTIQGTAVYKGHLITKTHTIFFTLNDTLHSLPNSSDTLTSFCRPVVLGLALWYHHHNHIVPIPMCGWGLGACGRVL